MIKQSRVCHGTSRNITRTVGLSKLLKSGRNYFQRWMNTLDLESSDLCGTKNTSQLGRVLVLEQFEDVLCLWRGHSSLPNSTSSNCRHSQPRMGQLITSHPPFDKRDSVSILCTGSYWKPLTLLVIHQPVCPGCCCCNIICIKRLTLWGKQVELEVAIFGEEGGVGGGVRGGTRVLTVSQPCQSSSPASSFWDYYLIQFGNHLRCITNSYFLMIKWSCCHHYKLWKNIFLN